MAEVFGVLGVVTAVASVAVAAWQANHARRKDKIESCNDLDTIYENLIEISGMLSAIRDDYENALQKNGARMKATSAYTNWSDKVIKWKVEADKVINLYESQRQTWSWKFHHEDMKRNMKKKSLDANKLCEHGAQLGDIFVEKEPDRFIKMNALDIKNLPTFQNHLQTILNWVTAGNNKVRCVRVWGTPGSGKSIIMKNLNNHEKVHVYFDFVIWLNVSAELHENNLGIDKLRQKVAQRLKLNLEGVGDHEVADMIKEKLKNKKTLLLLNDVKKNLKLEEIGLDPNNENEIKIVLTTTVKSVFWSMVDKYIEVKSLSDDEAFEMFKGSLAQSQNEDPYIQCIVVQIVQYCAGLPFLLHKLANSFKMRDTVDSWNEGLDSLRVWGNPGDNHMTPLYKLLYACFDELGEAQEKCFLYTALYPQDCDVYKDCLYECWAAEELYGNSGDIDSESLRACGTGILEHLKDATLLEECVNREYVRMQKWVRQAALHRLDSNDNQEHLVETGKSLKRPPKDEQWKNKVRISLADNDLETLPTSPECSNLSTLFLQKNPLLTTIPDSFFESMEMLKVLNVNDTGINSFPSSTAKLTNVKVVYLNGCGDLGIFPSHIVELKNVEVLDISRSGIGNIPCEIEGLHMLRRLSVSFPNFDNEESYGVVSKYCDVISKVPKLEVLIIDVESHKNFCNEMQIFVIEKFASTLLFLTTFKFCFDGGVEEYVVKTVASTPTFNVPTSDAFKGFLQRRDISESKSFRVFIGYSSLSRPQIPNFKNYKRYLRYCNGVGSDDTTCKLLTKVDALEMFHINELEYLSEFGTTNLDKIQGCLIGACNQIRAVANNLDCPILSNLEDLYIKMMPALESILKGPIPSGSLCKLKTLKIESCHLIEEVLADSGTAIPNDELFPHLEMLKIEDCPLITMICSYNLLVWPALKELEIVGCQKLTELPFGKHGGRKMESIKAEKAWWGNLTWRDQEVKGRLLNSSCFHLS